MSPRECSVYTVGDTIRWVVDDDRVIVVDDTVPAAHVFQGRDALIWRFLTLSHGYRKLVEFLAEVSDLAEPDAEQELRAVLERWARYGVLSRAKVAGNG
jgi:hypothetical protein